MTDTNRIDLDELSGSDDADDEPDASRGDWFWQGDGDPDAEPDEPEYDPAESGVSRRMAADVDQIDSTGTTDGDAGGDAADADADSDTGAADAAAEADADAADDATDDDTASHAAVDDDRGAIPRVPRENDDSPVGVPSDAGGAGPGAGPSEAARRQSGGGSAGAGGGAVDDGADAAPGTPEGRNPEVGTNEARKAVEAGQAEAQGPHGGGVDDMTMAISYNAMTQLSDPQLTVAKAREWADWIGIVGEVKAPVINQFQRENTVDADFFNGTGTGPAERLANIGETSMFYAERMVLVGTPEDEWIAEEAGWEFIPFESAAEKADWQREE
ncbi:DUF7124 domain-containing protein [Haloparvum sp. AD34]